MSLFPRPLLVLALALGLGACEGATPPHLDPHSAPLGEVENTGSHNVGRVFGEDGLSLSNLLDFGRSRESSQGSGIGVNAFLWRATLDVMTFMPLASADPFGGVIITDWYSPPDTPDERLKANVYILGRELRSDGIRVSIFRQTRSGAGAPWQESTVKPETNTQLEDRILSRARELRAAALAAADR